MVGIFGNTFPYTAKNCKTEDSIVEALTYYYSLKGDIHILASHQLNNYYSIVDSMERRLSIIRGVVVEKLYDEVMQKDRLFYYYKSILLSTEFLNNIPNGEKLDQLFICLKESLKLSGSEWNALMYTDSVTFDNQFTPGEKKVYFIHKILISGLHETKTIISIINCFIKLINILQLRDIISVDLPQKKDLHNVSFIIPNYSY